MAKTIEKTGIEIQEIRMGRIRCNIVGTTPMIMHRFSSKARRELLFPSPRKNQAERAETLKHDPIGEFREAAYINRNESEAALCHYPSNAFGEALAAVAIDIPGATRAQMERLTTITSTQVNLFGCPELYMTMVRSSDMARTPDVRSRPIFPEWACTVEIQFVQSLLKEKQVVNLMAAAGVIVGLGDWRPQKGGSFGQFRLADDNDADFARIVKSGGRAAQLKAFVEAKPHDADTEELLAWFKEEVQRREKAVPSDADVWASNAIKMAVADTTKLMKRPKANGRHHASA